MFSGKGSNTVDALKDGDGGLVTDDARKEEILFNTFFKGEHLKDVEFFLKIFFYSNFARNAPRTVHGLSLPLCNLFSFNASFFITLSKLSVLRTFDSLLDGIPSLAEFIFQ